MTTKHTPGPWIGAGPSFGDPLPRYTTEIITESEDENGEVRSICELPVAHHDDENEANARLIAAAPELLAALKLIASAENSALDLAYCKGIARAAIAKATGEQAFIGGYDRETAIAAIAKATGDAASSVIRARNTNA